LLLAPCERGLEAGGDRRSDLFVEGLHMGLDELGGTVRIACPKRFEDGAVLVDATCSGRAPGTVHEPAADALREARPLSSHGLGVREALAMADALGRAPERLAIIGIEAATTTGDEMSRPVHAALAEAAARARRRCAEWLAGSGHA